MTFSQIMIATIVIYFCAYTLLNRLCKCIEHCATASAFSKYCSDTNKNIDAEEFENKIVDADKDISNT